MAERHGLWSQADLSHFLTVWLKSQPLDTSVSSSRRGEITCDLGLFSESNEMQPVWYNAVWYEGCDEC